MNEKKIIRMKVFLLLNSSIYLGLKIHVVELGLTRLVTSAVIHRGLEGENFLTLL